MSFDEDKQQGEEGRREETRKESPVENDGAGPNSDAALSPALHGDDPALRNSLESRVSLELSRSERKREREKKRRSDVNKGLDTLMDLVFIIDPQLKLEAEERAAKSSGGRTSSADAPILSRVELVNSCVVTLERIHRENEERKLVIARLARGLLSGGGGAAAPEPASAPALPPNVMPPFLNPRDIQRQELQQQLNLEALLASSSGMAGIQQALRGSLLPEARALGLGGGGGTAQRGPASLARPPLPAPGLQFGGRNPAAASFLGGASSLQPGLSDGGLLAIPNANDAQGLGRGNPTDSALYRALVNRRIQDEESAALAAAGLPPIGSGSLLGAGGMLGRTNPSLLSRSSEATASPVRLSGDSIRQAVMREQTIAQAAAANSYFANEDGNAAKRFKRHLS